MPAVTVSGVDGTPGGIHALAGTVRSLQDPLDTRAAHLRAATAVLEGNHGKHVAQLRGRIDPLPQRYEALGAAYAKVATILDDYANAVSNLQADATALQNQVDDDTYRLTTTRQACLDADPTFPARLFPWDQAPSAFSAPNMPYLGQWHSSIDDLACSRDSLAKVAGRRQSLDEETAARLRDVTVEGPGVKDWLHDLGPALALLSPGKKVTLESLKVAKIVKLTKAFEGATPADELWIANQITKTATGTGVPAEGLLDSLGLTELPGLMTTLETVGRWLGPIGGALGAVLGVKDIVEPEHDGWRGVGDRVVGLVGVIGGVATILLACGVITAPAALVTGISAGVVVGGWKLGNAIYDHWDDIAEAARPAEHAVERLVLDYDYYTHHQDALGDKLRAVAKEYWNDPRGTEQRAENWVRGLFS